MSLGVTRTFLFACSVLWSVRCDTCPDLSGKVQSDFKFANHSGDYVMTQNVPVGPNFTCISLKFEPSDKRVQVAYRAYSSVANQEVKMSGNLTWQGDNQAVVTVEVIDATDQPRVYNGYILSSDYESTLFYWCLDNNGTIKQSASIVARNSTLEESRITELRNQLNQTVPGLGDQLVNVDLNTCSSASAINLSVVLIALVYCLISLSMSQ